MRDEAVPGGKAVRGPGTVHAAALAFATLSLVRLTRAGVIGSLFYLVAGGIWVVAASPTWVWHVPIAWFVLVAAIGLFVPGVANQVSLARAYLAGPAFMYASAAWYGPLAVVVAVGGLSDLVDGTVARRLAQPTSFGGGLDPVVDGLFMGALCIGLSLGGALPLWLALVVIARYLLPALAGGVLVLLGRAPELRHTLTGQVSTILILVLVGGSCLLRGLNQDPSGLIRGAEGVIPLATLATFVHLGWAVSRRPVGVAEAG